MPFQLLEEHYYYIIIALFLLVMSAFVLQKSRSPVNLYFVATPIIFAIMTILTIVNYFIGLGYSYLEVLYLIAPLGVLLSVWYIFHGQQIYKTTFPVIFLTLYIVYVAVNQIMFFYPDLSQNAYTINHFVVTIPMSIALFNFLKLKLEIPEQAKQINILVIGIVINIMGFVIRGIVSYTDKTESIEGLVVTIVGIIIVIFAFRTISKTSS